MSQVPETTEGTERVRVDRDEPSARRAERLTRVDKSEVPLPDEVLRVQRGPVVQDVEAEQSLTTEGPHPQEQEQ